MNKDKAMQLLERLQDPDYYQITSEAFDAIQMAIDALSADGDTISRKAAIDALVAETIYTEEELREYYEANSHRNEWVNGIYEAIEAIKQLPSAQPEIIRCKDCKHWIPYDWMFSEVWQSRNINDYPEDEIGCNYCDMAMKANDFCSRAERKEVTE